MDKQYVPPPSPGPSRQPALVSKQRPSTVCTSCRKQKTKCDRRTPCESCIKKKADCEYPEGASDVVDLPSVNNRVTSLENISEWFFSHIFHFGPDVIQNLANGYPPEDFEMPAFLTGAPKPTRKRLTSLVGMSNDTREVGATSTVDDPGPSRSAARSGKSARKQRGVTTTRGSTTRASNATFGRSSTIVPMQDVLDLTEQLGIDVSTFSEGSHEEGNLAEPATIRAATSELEQLQHMSVNEVFSNPSPNVRAVLLAGQLFLTPPATSSTSSSTLPSVLFPPTPTPPGIISLEHFKHLPSPTSNICTVLLADFSNVMVSHPCLSPTDLRRRIEDMLRAGSRADRASQPLTTLALFAVAAAAFALGAQAYDAKVVDGGRPGNSPSGYVPPTSSAAGPSRMRTTSTSSIPVRDRQGSAASARGRTSSMAGSVAMSVDDRPPAVTTNDNAAETRPEALALAIGSIRAAPRQPRPSASVPSFGMISPSSSIPFPTAGPPSAAPLPLPKGYEPDTLHALAQAALIAHDALGLAPSLDYIVAHQLCWLFKLHAPLPLAPGSPREDATGEPALGGAPTTIDAEVWKGLGKVINVARGMGLHVDPDEIDPPPSETKSSRRRGEEESSDESGEGGKMSLWEREMRRRVWWDLCFYDAYISDCMGFPPLIDDMYCTTRMPTDVDDSEFGPQSTSLPPPSEDASEGANVTYFIQRCKIVTLLKTMKKQSFSDSPTGELSFDSVSRFDDELEQYTKQLPDQFSVDFRLDDSSSASTATVTAPPRSSDPSTLVYSVPPPFPASDVIAAQACELQSMVNSLLLKIWTPHVKSTQKLRNNAALQACTNAAHGIVVASHHLLNRFRLVRPAAYAFYGFGRMVFGAGVVLAKVVLTKPGQLYAESALNELKVALQIMKDPVVAGTAKRQSPSIFPILHRRQETRSTGVGQATKILEVIKDAAEGALSGFAASGSKKRKLEEQRTGLQELRAGGFQVPYVGGRVVAAPTAVEAGEGAGPSTAEPGSASQRRPAVPSSAAARRPSSPGPPPDWTPPIENVHSGMDGAFPALYGEAPTKKARSTTSQPSETTNSSLRAVKPAIKYPLVAIRRRPKDRTTKPQGPTEAAVSRQSSPALVSASSKSHGKQKAPSASSRGRKLGVRSRRRDPERVDSESRSRDRGERPETVQTRGLPALPPRPPSPPSNLLMTSSSGAGSSTMQYQSPLAYSMYAQPRNHAAGPSSQAASYPGYAMGEPQQSYGAPQAMPTHHQQQDFRPVPDPQPHQEYHSQPTTTYQTPSATPADAYTNFVVTRDSTGSEYPTFDPTTTMDYYNNAAGFRPGPSAAVPQAAPYNTADAGMMLTFAATNGPIIRAGPSQPQQQQQLQNPTPSWTPAPQDSSHLAWNPPSGYPHM